MSRENYPIPLIGSRLPLHVPVSFETDEVGTFKLPALGYRVRVVGTAKSVVTKTVAGSNSGTITVKNGATTVATITVAASSALGDEDSASVTETVFEADEQITLTTAKVTAGGRAHVTLTVEILPPHA